MTPFLTAVAAAVAIAASPTGAVEKIDLPGAVSKAMEQNLSLARSELEIRTAVLGIQLARSEFDFKLKTTGSAGVDPDDKSLGGGVKLTKRMSWGAEVQSGADVTQYTVNGESNLYRGRLQLQLDQPLFRHLGTLINTEPVVMAGSREREARRKTEMIRSDIALAVAETYLDLLELGAGAEMAKEAVGRLDALAGLASDMEKKGKADRADIARVALLQGRVRMLLDRNEERYESRMRDLAELLGEDVVVTYSLAPVPEADRDVPAQGYCVSLALSNRLDHVQTLEDLVNAQRGVLIGRRLLMPDLDLIVRYELRGDGYEVEAASRLDDSIWFVGLTTDTDLGRATERVGLNQALTDRDLAEHNITIVSRGVRKQVLQLLSMWASALRQQEMARANCDVAAGRLKLVKELFAGGQGDCFDVTDSEEALLAAEDVLIKANTAATVSSWRLRHAMCTLVEYPPDLKLPHGP